MIKLPLIGVFAVILFLTSCNSSGEKRTSEAYLKSFLSENKQVVAFGKADVFTLLAKSNYQQVDKIGAIIDFEKKRIDQSINTKAPVCFALEGPFDQEGNPASLVAFVEVVNADSLADRLGSSGLFVEEGDGFQFAVNGDVSIGFSEHVAVVVSRKEKYDAKSILTSTLESLEKKEIEGKAAQILNEKSDVLAAINLENLYGTANTDLNKLDPNKQKEIQALAKDSYVKTSMNFLKGEIRMKTDHLFATPLQKRMFFKESDSQVVEKLGKGKARFGISSNLDIARMEAFIDDFAPEAKKKFFQSNGQLQMASMLLGEKPLTQLFSGVIGLVMVGDLLKDGSFTPEVNFHLGLGDKGKMISDMASTFFSLEGSKVSNGSITYQGMRFIINDREVTGNTLNAGGNLMRLEMPTVASDFGKGGLTVFADLSGLNTKSFGFRGGQKVVELIQDAHFSMNNDGSELVIRFHDKNQNVLSQVVQLFLRDIQQQVEGLVI